MKPIAFALAAALAGATTFAAAQSSGSAGPGQPGGPGMSADSYWKAHSREGYMTREQTMAWRMGNSQGVSKQGAGAADYNEIDTDHDGRTSQAEWMAWQRKQGATGAGSSTGMGAGGTGKP